MDKNEGRLAILEMKPWNENRRSRSSDSFDSARVFRRDRSSTERPWRTTCVDSFRHYGSRQRRNNQHHRFGDTDKSKIFVVKNAIISVDRDSFFIVRPAGFTSLCFETSCSELW